MSEIKHNFTGGKMNKDLDERLVKNGEYRDAMNIQVSDSDGSNVGVAQNIPGNKDIGFISPIGSKCLGSVSDEKNDVFYWFIHADDGQVQSDSIHRRNDDGTFDVIFRDIKAGTPNAVLKFNTKINAINVIDDLLIWTDNINEPRKININRCNQQTSNVNPTHTQVQKTDGSFEDIKEEHITVIKKRPTNKLAVQNHTSRVYGNTVALSSTTGDLTYSGVVSVTEAGLIPQTDDIYRSKSPDGVVNVSAHDFSNAEIGTTYRVTIPMSSDGNSDFELDWVQDNGVGVGGNSYSSGNAKWTGKKVVLKEYDSSGDAPPTPLTDYRIKGVLTNWTNVNNPQLISDTALQTPGSSVGHLMVEFKVTNLNGVPPTGSAGVPRLYIIDIFDEDENLFEYKFPRFSYRYKYKDDEYSTFAPWTNVAFVPGAFDYHPKKGYNIGMTNRLTSLTLSNFRPGDTPTEVTEIDILYKEEGSTTVYVVDTLKSNDVKTLNSNTQNAWDTNSYTISDETINAVVPKNQLIRPWDNVPRKALAQDITGNRIVYANYLQGYNLLSNSEQYYPDISVSILSRQENSSSAVKSIKSLREYQLGVLLVDEYGRETPILSSATGTFKLEKDSGVEGNKMLVDVNNFPTFDDPGIKYFKFFIKETAGEYYNMAMDRSWDAEDGNRWLSFPSSDRNKIDIDTFLILKKAAESSELITDPARYKVLAIENEAPDYIKQKKLHIESQTHASSGNVWFSGTAPGDIPSPGQTQFKMHYTQFESSSGSALHEIDDGVLYIEFGNSDGLASQRYRIAEITYSAANSLINYNVVLENPLEDDVAAFSNNTGMLDNTTLNIYKYVVENDAKFDGRFFVKIFADDTFIQAFESFVPETTTSYQVLGDLRLAYMSSDHGTAHSKERTGHTDTFVDGNSFNLLTRDSLYDKYFGRVACYFREYSTPNTNSNYDWGKQAGDNSPTVTHNVGKFKFGYDNTDPDLSAVGWGGTAIYPEWMNEFLQTTSSGHNDNQINYYGWSWSSVYYRSDINAPFESLNGTTPQLNKRDPDTEVWFIDAGKVYGHSGNHANGTLKATGNNTTVAYNEGIGVFGGNFLINVALGPISFDWPSNTYVGNPHPDAVGFWDIGVPGGNPQYDYTSVANIVTKLNVGTKWRFKEDPEKLTNVYTVTALNKKGHFRYTNTLYNEATQNNPNNQGDGWNSYLPPNYTKNYKLTCSPSIGTGWNPALGGFGYIASGYDLSINAAIISGSTSNTYDIADYYIVLDSNEATCVNTNQVVDIAVGMVVQSYNNGGNVLTTATLSDVNPALLVKKIEQLGSKYKVYLHGYMSPLDATHMFTPTTGQAVRFRQPLMNGYSKNSAKRISLEMSGDYSSELLGAVEYSIEFIGETSVTEDMPGNPAIWETEPKDESNLDIYHEISSYNALRLDGDTTKTAIPIGSQVEIENGNGSLAQPCFVVNNSDVGTTWNTGVLTLDQPTDGLQGFGLPMTRLKITKPDGDSMLVGVAQTPSAADLADTTTAPTSSPFFIVKINKAKATDYELDWHNCYSFLNGVESNRIRDNFNLPFISNGPTVSTILEDKIKAERREYGLIFSGIYNSISGVNDLNQFIQAEKITKDINPIYGSIQKLYSRSTADGDLITLCEDRVLKILANKDAVFNADGNPQLTSNLMVLGQAIPYAGEYGISKNPESFASESYRVYFADKQRGAILRLSKDGITPISKNGMKDWFRDNLKLNNFLLGSYDDNKDEYNITLQETTETIPKTVSFKEDVNGWVSFKSFVPEDAISCANEYYTFADGIPYQHGITSYEDSFGEEIPNYNNFYGDYTDSSLTVLLNDAPSSVKSFNTIGYEGSKSKIDELTPASASFTNILGQTVAPPNTLGWQDDQYYNTSSSKGWFVSNIITDMEKGSVNEFIEKEGKFFNYIKGLPITFNINNILTNTSNFDTSSLAVQGLGTISTAPAVASVFGCMDPNAFNYMETATINAVSMTDSTDPCIATIQGCTDPSSYLYNEFANEDNGSCQYAGCTDDGNIVGFSNSWDSPYPGQAATNYNPNADWPCATDPDVIYWQGSGGINACCTYDVDGCTDATAFNYNPQANIDDGSCIATVLGCTDPMASNTSSAANTEDGSCVYQGCIDSTADNYVNPAPGQPAQGAGLNNSLSPNAKQRLAGSANGGTGSGGELVSGNNYTGSGGCDPTIPYQSILPYPGIIQYACCTGTPSLDWPDITHAIDVGGNQVDFTHDWSAIFQGLQFDLHNMVNPLPPCATVDDGSCSYGGCSDPNAGNFDPMANTGNTTDCLYCGAMSTIDPTVQDPAADNWDGAVDANSNPFTAGCEFCPQANVTSTVTSEYNCTPNTYCPNGATLSFNWDVNLASNEVEPTAMHLKYREVGATSWSTEIVSYVSNQVNYQVDITGLTPDTDYELELRYYCADSMAWPTIDNLSSITTTTIAPNYTGCTDPTAINYFNLAVTDDGSCNYTGCMLSNAINYIPTATITCLDDVNYPVWSYYDVQTGINTTYGGLMQNMPNVCCNYGGYWYDTVYGCMDSNAENYCSTCIEDTFDYGYPICQILGCTNDSQLTTNNNPDVNGYCTDAVYTVQNSVTTYTGGTQVAGSPGAWTQTCDDVGQTGYDAENYNPAANYDELNSSSCIYTGCGAPGCDGVVGYNGNGTITSSMYFAGYFSIGNSQLRITVFGDTGPGQFTQGTPLVYDNCLAPHPTNGFVGGRIKIEYVSGITGLTEYFWVDHDNVNNLGYNDYQFGASDFGGSLPQSGTTITATFSVYCYNGEEATRVVVITGSW